MSKRGEGNEEEVQGGRIIRPLEGARYFKYPPPGNPHMREPQMGGGYFVEGGRIIRPKLKNIREAG